MSWGHIQDMKNRYEENRAQMKLRRERYNRIRDAYMSHVTYKSYHARELHLSKEELEIIKVNIRTKLRKQRIRATIYSSIVTTIIAAIIIYYLYTKLF